MRLNDIENQIRRFLSGRSSKDGKILFDQWYDSTNSKNITLAEEERARLKNKLYQKISARMNTREHNTLALRLQRKKRHKRQLMGIAAAVGVLLIGAAAFFQLNASRLLVVQTSFEERHTLDLPDGTRVVLNANSRLTYYDKNPREVWLDGEAFFDVMKKEDGRTPFMVHTEDLVVEVLGTAFNVNSRRRQTKVVLEEGSVKLKLGHGEEAMMKPGDLIAYSAEEARILEKRSVQPQVHSSWKSGSLIFHKTPLSEAIQKVSDNYGVHFKFERPELKQKVIQGGVPMDNLQLSLRLIEKSIHVTIRQKEDHYLISPKQKFE